MPQQMALRFETDVRTLRPIRKFVRDLAVSYGGSEEDAWGLEVATGEVLINAHEHAYGQQSGPVEIEVVYDEAKVELTVHNHGAPITDVPVIPRTAPSGDRGRGLYLVGQLTDEAEVSRTRDGHKGVSVRLTKYLHPE